MYITWAKPEFISQQLNFSNT